LLLFFPAPIVELINELIIFNAVLNQQIFGCKQTGNGYEIFRHTRFSGLKKFAIGF
jgi:hypothetical protein